MKKRIMTILMVAFLAILQVGIVRANAEILPLSSDIFLNANVDLQTTGVVTFMAKTHQRTTIKVDSCILQKKEGNNWVFDQSLSCPPSVSNAIRYSKNMDYSAKLTSGTTYRIVAVFAADGETRTATSDGIAY